MNYKPIKAVMLRNNDRIIDVDGAILVKGIELNFLEDIVTFTATKEDGSVSERWIAMDRLVNKVTSWAEWLITTTVYSDTPDKVEKFCEEMNGWKIWAGGIGYLSVK